MSLTAAQVNAQMQAARGQINQSVGLSGGLTGGIANTMTSRISSFGAQQKLDLANTALAALISKTESYLLTNAELAEKAWLIADEMAKEAQKRGVYI